MKHKIIITTLTIGLILFAFLYMKNSADCESALHELNQNNEAVLNDFEKLIEKIDALHTQNRMLAKELDVCLEARRSLSDSLRRFELSRIK